MIYTCSYRSDPVGALLLPDRQKVKGVVLRSFGVPDLEGESNWGCGFSVSSELRCLHYTHFAQVDVASFAPPLQPPQQHTIRIVRHPHKTIFKQLVASRYTLATRR